MSYRWNLPGRSVSLRQADRQHRPTATEIQLNPADMDNMPDKVDEGIVREERRGAADSPVRDPKPQESGEVEEQHSEVQVHAAAGSERGSPDYMDTRDGHKSGSSSSSSSDDDEVREEVKAAEHVEEVQVEELSGDVHAGSRRSSASSVSFGDPCDDPPIQVRIQEEDDAEDGTLMAHLHPDTDPKPEESVDYSLKTLETVSLDESSADSSHPEVSLYVKVRQIQDQHRPDSSWIDTRVVAHHSGLHP